MKTPSWYSKTTKNKEVTMRIITEITLDLSRQGIQCSIPITQHDAGTRRIIVHLRNGMKPVKLSEHDTAVLFFEGDNFDPVAVYTENGAYPNSLVYDVTPNASITEGEHIAVLQIFKGVENVTYTPRFALVVARDLTNGSAVLQSPQYAAVLKAQYAAEEYARQAEKSRLEMVEYVDAEVASLYEQKLDITDEPKVIHGTDEEGIERLIPYGSDSTAGAILQNDASGFITVKYPVADTNPVTKAYALGLHNTALLRTEEAEERVTQEIGDVELRLLDYAAPNEEFRELKSLVGEGVLQTFSQDIIGAVNDLDTDVGENRRQININRLNVANVTAQAQGIARSFVLPDFPTFISFINDNEVVSLYEDRDGDGVRERYDISILDLKTGDNILLVEKDVPDFWFEQTDDASTADVYKYKDTEYSLRCAEAAGYSTIGIMHVSETDYTVLAEYATSTSLNADIASKAKTTAVEAANTATAAATRAETAADRAEAAASEAAAAATEAAQEEVAQLVGEIGIAQELGDSDVKAMSQAAVTAEFDNTEKTHINGECVVENLDYVNKVIGGDDGQVSTTEVSNRITSQNLVRLPLGANVRKTLETGYTGYFYWYDADGNYLGVGDMPESAYYFRFCLGKDDDSDITPTEARENVQIKFVYVDSTVSLKNDIYARIKKVYVNEFDENNTTDGYLASPTSIESSSSYATTDFIKVYKGESITITPRCRKIGHYDELKEGLSVTDVSSTSVTFVVEQDGYIRVTIFTADIGKVMIEHSDTASDYVEHGVMKIEENVDFSNQQKDYISERITESSSDTKAVTYYHPNLFNAENLESGYLDSGGNIIASTSYVTTEYIAVSAGESVAISPQCRFACLYDTSKKFLTFNSYSNMPSVVLSVTQDGYVRFTIYSNSDFDAVLIEKADKINEYFPPSLKRIVEDVHFSKAMEEQLGTYGNPLYGKKYVAIGDSFTEGDFANSLTNDYIFTDGLYKGKNKVYPFYVGRRNNMTVVNMGLCGSTITSAWADRIAEAEAAGNTSLVNYYREMGFSLYRYQEIPTDADYITIKYGINDDSGHRNVPIGTIDDTENTTFYGAWNIVMEWIITNLPFAKVGIIVSNGVTNSDTADYSEAVRNISKKWGIPYLDEDAGEQVPVLHRTNHANLIDSVKEARKAAFSVNPTSNLHPNEKAHEYESTFVENFLRSL